MESGKRRVGTRSEKWEREIGGERERTTATVTEEGRTARTGAAEECARERGGVGFRRESSSSVRSTRAEQSDPSVRRRSIDRSSPNRQPASC